MNEKITLNGYQISENYGCNFIKIFEQRYNCNRANLFKENEANFSLTKNKFSLLKFINDDFRINDSFEFILYYDELDLIIHWSQKRSIHEITKDVDYTPLHVNESLRLFYGLARSNITASFIDGEPDSITWYYCIGMRNLYSHETIGTGIPGPYIQNLVVVNKVSLWIRLPNIDLVNKFPHRKTFCTHKVVYHNNRIVAYLLAFIITA